ncbi:MAG: ATP-binding cassette domain-containing protein, partial [Propionibacteriaceae bacterium]|nr:ATP-binding cassette domain-containing protein [Propionibacteriaceae bacterium]
VYRGGQVLLRGEPVSIPDVETAIKLGLAYLPEDRKTLGLNLLDTISKTIVSANLGAVMRGGLLDPAEERRVAEEYRAKVGIKTPSVDVAVSTLSGGNQQKSVIAKWMFAEPDILILDEPTRGIDVGAKYEIYQQMQSLAGEGKAIMMISSELPELLGICDRIYAVCEGRITGVVDSQDADQESLMRLMTTLSQQTTAPPTDSEGNTTP